MYYINMSVIINIVCFIFFCFVFVFLQLSCKAGREFRACEIASMLPDTDSVS